MTLKKKNVPAARRQQILEWMKEEGSLSIKDLEDRLGVSHMTIHRDLDKLAKQNLIRKVRAGAVLGPGQKEVTKSPQSCAMCGGRVPRRSEFITRRKGESQIYACCPHCGILTLSAAAEESALTRDYLYGRMVNVYEAYYVIASDVHLCCVPSILCFAAFSDAQKFSGGFGGKVMNFSQVLVYLQASHQHDHR